MKGYKLWSIGTRNIVYIIDVILREAKRTSETNVR